MGQKSKIIKSWGPQNGQEMTPVPWSTTGRGAQPQASGSGARLKELTKKLATRNSPFTVLTYTVANLEDNALVIVR